MDTRDFSPSYHDLVRPEIAMLVPPAAEMILDLGCGAGGLGAHIKARQPCEYRGIEINSKAAAIAKTRIDRVFGYNIEDHPSTNTRHDYDTLICADILEHLPDPRGVLEFYVKELSETGIIIASFPNIAHPSIIADLNRGLFRYATAGVLDRTHLHHFTLTSIFQLFSQLNLKITKVIPSPNIDNPIQWLITAKKAPCYGRKNIATIIIPSSSKQGFIKGTLESIRINTEPNVRIIAINNALPTELSSWIEQQDDMLEIRCAQNIGFTTAVNLGIEISDTPYTVILNDDVLVTQNWLTQLIACSNFSKDIGIVGPISNRVTGPQKDKNACYIDAAGLAVYASRVTKENAYRWIPFRRIVFFCALIKKEVIDKLGCLDEQFSPGNYEDDDYCLRAIDAGYRNMIDGSTFVHHYGSASWQDNPLAYSNLLKKNQALFLQKWGSRGSNFLSLSSK